MEPPAVQGDDASIRVQLRRLNPAVRRLAFIVSINEAQAHGYNFGGVQQAYVRILDRSARRELLRFQLTDYYNTVCSMVVGELYRYQDHRHYPAKRARLRH